LIGEGKEGVERGREGRGGGRTTYLDVEVLQEGTNEGLFLLWVGRDRGKGRAVRGLTFENPKESG